VSPRSASAASPEFTPPDVFLEDLLDGLAGDDADADDETNPSLAGDTETSGEEETDPTEADGENADADVSVEAQTEDDNPEMVEDAATGKKFVKAKDFNRMHRQRNEAKQKAAEAARELEAARVKLAELESKLTTVEDKPVVVAGDENPLAEVVSLDQLAKAEQQAKAWRSWCRANPHGGTLPSGEDKDAEFVGATLDWVDSILESLPQRREFLEGYTATRAKVRAENPKMFTAGTDEHRAYQAYQKQLLSFRSAKDQDAIIAKLIKLDTMEREEREGIASYPRVAKKKAEAAPAGTAKPAPRQINPRPAGQISVTSATGSSAWDKLNQPGASVAFEDLLG
jgi:hypothetical protein